MLNNIEIKKDLIYVENQAYVKIDSQDTLIRQAIKRNVQNAYAFKKRFGHLVSEQTVKKYDGSYWARMPELDKESQQLLVR